MIFAELKSDSGQPTVDQWVWLYILQSIGSPVEAYLWRPSDFDEIAEVLR